MKRKVVAYFSATGTTRKVAEMIAECLKADIYEIKPMVPYTDEDLDWTNKKSRSSIEMSDKEFRPEMLDTDLDLNVYDEIILGFPIWWYVAPTIVNTFLEKYNLSGKKLILFATSGGSGFGNTVNELKSSAVDSLIVEGKVFQGVNKKQIANWVATLKKKLKRLISYDIAGSSMKHE